MTQLTVIEQNTVEYFRAFKCNFWRRAEGGEVYEWYTGVTICFRKYLEELLTEVAKDGLPDLGAILLVIAAARDTDQTPWFKTEMFEVQMEFAAVSHQDSSAVRRLLEDAVNLLNLVRELPPQYRGLSNLSHLIVTLFGGMDGNLDAELGNSVVREYRSGRLEKHLEGDQTDLTGARFRQSLEPLGEARKRFEDLKTLLTALRTGLKDVPDPADLVLPPPEKGDLLDELEADDRSYGMARLARRLMAAIHIPLHSRGSSDQPFGGVSDITNRGDFDRLLLSELAYEDSTLIARLANNEALYLRREEPPQDLIEKRIVLLDTTLKMWGIPRVYAISAALACTVTEQNGIAVGAHALKGESCEDLDLGSKEGVIDALSMLDASLHCGAALSEWAQARRPSQQEEVIFITSGGQLHSAAFQPFLAEAREKIDYLITVSRDGQMQFFQYSGGRRKLLNQAVLDLSESLFARPKRKWKTVNSGGNDPAFYRQEKAPMLFPKPGGALDKKLTYAPGGDGILSILPNRRVLYWRRYTGKAAQEVLPIIEQGDYGFGNNDRGIFSILVSERKSGLLKLYTYDTKQEETREMDLSDKAEKWYGFRFRDGYFIVDMPGSQPYTRDYLVVDPARLAIVSDQFTGTEISDMVYKGRETAPQMNGHEIKLATNQGYSMLKKIPNVSISPEGRLQVGKRELYYEERRHGPSLEWKLNPNYSRKSLFADRVENGESYDSANPTEYFRRYVWPDGSEALGDTRGFLHLISSDSTIPHISIAMIIDLETSLWAEGIGLIGNSVFFPVGSSAVQKESYWNVVQAFVDVIMKKCS